MNLKKYLKSESSQAVVEYILLFVILSAAILFVFGGVNPDQMGISGVFNHAVESAISQINQ